MSAQGRNTAAGLRLVSLGLLVGILVIYTLPRLPAWPVLLLFLLLCLSLLPWTGRWPGRITVLAALAGAGLAIFQVQMRLDDHLPPGESPRDLWLSGEIAGLPERQAQGDRQDWRFLFTPASDLGPRRIRVSWYRTDTVLRAGQCWHLLLRLKSPRGLMNPGGFDYEAWLFREGIGATGYVRDAEPCPEAETADRHDLRRGLLHLRQQLVERVTDLLPQHPLRGFVLGLTVGDASAIDDGQWRVLRRTGTTHLLSISGLHITLAAGFVFFIARWLWALCPALCLRLPAQRAAALAAMLSAVAYALLAGFSIPTQRSLVMLLVVMLALLGSRPLVPSHLLSVALLAVLLMDTSAVLHPGFWLSFGAVAWMLYALAARVGPVPRWQQWLGPQWVLAVALLVPCLFWFGESSLVSPLANAMMIPLFSLLIPWLLATVALLQTMPGEWMLQAGVHGLELLWHVLCWLAELPAAYGTWTPPSWPLLLLATLGLLVALGPRGLPARPMGLLLCLPVLLVRPLPPPPGHFDFTLLDVGQGHAAVVRTAAHVLLFDTGPATPGGLNTGEAVVLPYLRQQGIRHLDRLVLSHADLDHRGGLVAIRDGIAIGEEIGTDRGRACRAGEQWSWDGVGFEFLHPDDEGWSRNEGSCVLRITAGAHALLLTGDIQALAEARLVERSAHRLRADVLVVPHHGSRSSSGTRFIEAVNPQLALVPSGWANRWGFPKPEVVARYVEAGAQVEVSGHAGAIQLRVDPQRGVQRLSRWREQSRRLWRAG